MSSRLVGLVLEHYPAGGGELVLAIAIADEAAHSGGNVRALISEMAHLSRQKERNVRLLLRKMEASGWLQCLERGGGKGRASLYQINPEWVRLPVGFGFAKPGNNPAKFTGFEGSKPGKNYRVCEVAPFLSSITPPIPPQPEKSDNGSAVPSDVVRIDLDLGVWMLGKLRLLNPGHREPNWKRWTREIRLMRERDGRTHRQIAELFAWANADPFWQTNILSPGKLRAQWDALEIKRKVTSQRKPANGYQPEHATASPLCARCGQKPWTWKRGTKADDAGYCSDCREIIETQREEARA